MGVRETIQLFLILIGIVLILGIFFWGYILVR
nr:MAG TPA: Protein translocase subunit SecY, Protein, membrane protein, PROTEIN TRANSPORT-IMMUNE [Caudoviricetes sp.]